jgi:hypothetical protein
MLMVDCSKQGLKAVDMLQMRRLRTLRKSSFWREYTLRGPGEVLQVLLYSVELCLWFSTELVMIFYCI